jgi:hypothetical protein
MKFKKWLIGLVIVVLVGIVGSRFVKNFIFDNVGLIGRIMYPMPYSQGVFKYQVKCLANLRTAYTELSDTAKDELKEILRRTGCLSYLLDT